MPTARVPGLLRHGRDGSEAAGRSTHSGPQVPPPLSPSFPGPENPVLVAQAAGAAWRRTLGQEDGLNALRPQPDFV